MNKDVAWLQEWLNSKGANLKVDGVGGSMTRAAFITLFANKDAKAITQAELDQIAKDLGDTSAKRIQAVAKVESAGSGWFDSGLPKILYERHKFYKHTKGRFGTTYFSNRLPGGYTMDADHNGINDSWEKLATAVCLDPKAALMSVSIGKFQVMGEYYAFCGYEHPIEMLWAARNSEYAHYTMLRDFILKVANIKPQFLRLSTNPTDNIPFVSRYNGPAYAKNNYHVKIAQAMR